MKVKKRKRKEGGRESGKEGREERRSKLHILGNIRGKVAKS